MYWNGRGFSTKRTCVCARYRPNLNAVCKTGPDGAALHNYEKGTRLKLVQNYFYKCQHECEPMFSLINILVLHLVSRVALLLLLERRLLKHCLKFAPRRGRAGRNGKYSSTGSRDSPLKHERIPKIAELCSVMLNLTLRLFI